MMGSVILSGFGLHTGAPAQVTVEVSDGPLRLRANGIRMPLRKLSIASTYRSTTVCARGGRLNVAMVEHALAALAGLGIREGCTLAVDGAEMPLLDGGAAGWCEAMVALGLSEGPPTVCVAREAVIEVGPSRYELSPCDRVDVGVRIEIADRRVAPEAAWAGEPHDFRTRIAPARTFVLVDDIADLARRGLARYVDPNTVIVITRDTIHCAGRPFSADEPARHKLLDLLGDMVLFGGPPWGCVRALRPGHAANVEAFRRAWELGVFVAAQP
ncbi:MAG: UDP-3-O-acyl-N-acetylglucosamine deacetylase [Myxococcota bacterium]|nr:UDP-3-O-acyl-N-acetylglucosamine deacetylase [Myxococcota bacterium]